MHPISSDHVLLSLQKVAFTPPHTKTIVPTKYLFDSLNSVQQFTVLEPSCRTIRFDRTDDVDAILDDPQELERSLKAAYEPYYHHNRYEARTACHWSRSRGVEVLTEIQFNCYFPRSEADLVYMPRMRLVASGVGSLYLVDFW